MPQWALPSFLKMLKITKAAANTLYLTGSEKATNITAATIIEFKHTQTGEIKVFQVTDTSAYTYRFNKYTFTEGSSAAKTLKEGEHTYRLIGQDVLNTSSYEPDGVHYELLETGLAVVKDTDAADTVYSPTETNKVYEP